MMEKRNALTTQCVLVVPFAKAELERAERFINENKPQDASQAIAAAINYLKQLGSACDDAYSELQTQL
jgi:hypothetical protein